MPTAAFTAAMVSYSASPAGAAVQGQHRNAGLLGHARDGQRILVFAVPAGAELQGDRHVDRPHHRFQDALHQVFVLQQGRTAPVVAHFLDRAAHVDVDDLGAALDVEPGAVGQVFRVGAGDLHRLRLHLAFVIGTARTLFAGPQARVGSGHLRHRITGAELLAQLAERTVGHPGHGGDEDIVAKKMGTNIHGRKFTDVDGNSLFYPKLCLISQHIFFGSCCVRDIKGLQILIA
jgi:hypothetical protein